MVRPEDLTRAQSAALETDTRLSVELHSKVQLILSSPDLMRMLIKTSDCREASLRQQQAAGAEHENGGGKPLIASA